MDLREKFARTKIQYAFVSLFPQFLSVFTCIRYPIFFFRVRRDKKHEFHAQCMKTYHHINDNLSSIGSLIDPSSIAWNSLLLSQTTTSFSLPFDLALVYKHSLPTYQPACLPTFLPTYLIHKRCCDTSPHCRLWVTLLQCFFSRSLLCRQVTLSRPPTGSFPCLILAWNQKPNFYNINKKNRKETRKIVWVVKKQNFWTFETAKYIYNTYMYNILYHLLGRYIHLLVK